MRARGHQVVLLGMKHSGKSTLGRRLAGRWGCPFHDTDDVLATFHARESGDRLTAREIFARLGPDGFFDLEARALAGLAASLAGRDSAAPLAACHVIAAGGRTPLNPDAAGVLRSLGVAVLLEIPAAALWERVARGGIPAFVGTQDPRGDFLALAQAREPRYRSFADLVVPLDPQAGVEQNEALLAAAIEAYERERGDRSV